MNITERRAASTLATMSGRVGLSTVLPWACILLLWVILHGSLIAVGRSPVLNGDLIDTDGYMRLVSVAQLHETGAWFDHSIPRSNAPYGDILHWSRPLDLLLLSGTWLLAPFFDSQSALFWSGAFVSPLVMLGATFAMGWATGPFLARDCRELAMLAFLIQPAVLDYSMAGRADHHALQFLLFVLSIGLTIRLLTESFNRQLAFAAGTVAGIGLWVSLELILVWAIATAVLTLKWLQEGGVRAASNLTYTFGLVVTVAVALLLEHPVAALLSAEYDRLSIVHLVVVAMSACFWLCMWLTERWLSWPRKATDRICSVAVGALASGVVIYAAFPRFFAGPMADVDPALMPWLGMINELQPIVPDDVHHFGWFLFWLGPAAICLPFVLALLWVERRRETWVNWAYLGLLLAAYLPLAVLRFRVAPFAEIAAVPVLVSLIMRLRGQMTTITNPILRSAARSVATGCLLVGSLVAGSIFINAGSAAEPHTTNKSCRIADLAGFLNSPLGLGTSSQVIVANVNYGPELLYRTTHSVIGTPYHRNHSGILDTHRILEVTEDGTIKALIDERGVELLILCSGQNIPSLFPTGDGAVPLYRRLQDGRVPSWLRPIDFPGSARTDFRLYQVVR